jgi:hypothetical protein
VRKLANIIFHDILVDREGELVTATSVKTSFKVQQAV